MRILSVDTTNKVISIALSSKGRIYSIQRDIRLNNYESIISLIKLVLEKSKLGIKEIDYFGICIGPGSFTGIRIGLATMKALAYSASKPLVGFKSLDLIAYMVKDKFNGLLCIIQDARRNNVYSTLFSNNRGFRRVTPYFLTQPQQLFKKIKEINRKRINLYFYGEAISIYKGEIERNFPHSIILDHQNNNFKKGLALISITKDNLNQKSNSFKILPFYIYPKDCQVRRPVR